MKKTDTRTQTTDHENKVCDDVIARNNSEQSAFNNKHAIFKLYHPSKFYLVHLKGPLHALLLENEIEAVVLANLAVHVATGVEGQRLSRLEGSVVARDRHALLEGGGVRRDGVADEQFLAELDRQRKRIVGRPFRSALHDVHRQSRDGERREQRRDEPRHWDEGCEGPLLLMILL